MKNKIVILAVVATLALSACAPEGEANRWGAGNKQTVGTLGGAVLGGLAGSSMGKGSGRLWATGAGALLGGFVGSEIGKSLDASDRMYNAQAWDRAQMAPLYSDVSWRNPDTGHSGYITPVREGRNSYGYPCREYKQTIVVDGRAQSAYGTACQDRSGAWVLSNT
jgi:surface antigen